MMKKAQGNEERLKKMDIEAQKRIDEYNKNVDVYNRIAENPDYTKYAPVKLSKTRLQDLKTDEDFEEFSKNFDTVKGCLSRIDYLKDNFKKDKDEGFWKGLWDSTKKWYSNSETVQNVKDIINQELEGRPDDEVAQIKYIRGDQFKDIFKKKNDKDVVELSTKDVIRNWMNNEETKKYLKNIKEEDALNMLKLGVDFRLKNDFVNGRTLKLAHKAFLDNDESARSQLAVLGINKAEDLVKRKNQIARYVLLSNRDDNEIEPLFEKYGGLSQQEFDKKVIAPMKQIINNREIDMGHGLINKGLEIASLIKDGRDLKTELLEKELKVQQTREGTDAQANNNRMRDLIKSSFGNQYKANYQNLRESKIRNELIATLTGLTAIDGYANTDFEKQLMTSEEGRRFLIKGNGTIFNDENLKTEDDIKEARNRIFNYDEYRRYKIKSLGKSTKHKTINDVGTGNTGQSFAVPTKAEKEEEIDKVIKTTVNDEDGTDEQQKFERAKRTALFKSTIKENPKTLNVLNQVKDRRYITLKQLNEIQEKAKTLNEKELTEYGKQINGNIKDDLTQYHIEKQGKGDYKFINYRDVPQNKEFFKNRIDEYKKYNIPTNYIETRTLQISKEKDDKMFLHDSEQHKEPVLMDKAVFKWTEERIQEIGYDSVIDVNPVEVALHFESPWIAQTE